MIKQYYKLLKFVGSLNDKEGDKIKKEIYKDRKMLSRRFK